MSNIGRTVLLAAVLLFAFSAGLSQRAAAAETMRELSGTPYFSEYHPWLQAQVLPEQDDAMFEAASLLGKGLTSISGLSLRWPAGERRLHIVAGQYGDMRGSDTTRLETSICAGMSDGRMQMLQMGFARVPGFLAKVSAWPDSKSEDASLIVLMSFSDGFEESLVLGFRAAADGSITRVDTGNAHTQWGEFQVADLNDDGSYELLCYRNLDGTVGGLSYRSVRGYDSDRNAYVADADEHRRFFELQLEWLDWIISTRRDIMDNPRKYLDEGGFGSFYTAMYKGERFGFDSIIFVDSPDFPRDEAKAAREYSEEAFNRVKRYREELAGWLNGGPYPETWGIR